jgi:hypothetical protein
MSSASQKRSREQVEAPVERVADLAEDARDVIVRANIALGHKRTLHRLRQIADVLLDALALVREGKFGAAVSKPLRNRPRDRALVRDAENQTALAFIRPSHCASVRRRLRCRMEAVRASGARRQ